MVLVRIVDREHRFKVRVEGGKEGIEFGRNRVWKRSRTEGLWKDLGLFVM